MELLPIQLPARSHEIQQILAARQAGQASGVWTLLTRDSLRTLIYSSPAATDHIFVLPHDFVYLGSRSCGDLLFLVDDSSGQPGPIYELTYDSESGITASKTDSVVDQQAFKELVPICRPSAHQETVTTLHDSLLLNDNVLAETNLSAINVPYHSLWDVIQIRAQLSAGATTLLGCTERSGSLHHFKETYPFLSIVDSRLLQDGSVAIIANDSSVRTLCCDVESRLFVTNANNPPRLALGRSLFSADSTLSVAPASSQLAYPSLGLVLSSSDSSEPMNAGSELADISVYSVDYLTTTNLISSDAGLSFILADSCRHNDHDLVPMLMHHLDYSQTLVLSSKLDRSVIYLFAQSSVT